MVEKIEMQIILPPISSTVVKKVKQKNGNMQQKNFGRHLKEETKDNEEKRKSRQSPEAPELGASGNKGEEVSVTNGRRERKSQVNRKPDNITPGRLIDILA